jgi:hypothetical protein
MRNFKGDWGLPEWNVWILSHFMCLACHLHTTAAGCHIFNEISTKFYEGYSTIEIIFLPIHNPPGELVGTYARIVCR